MYDTQVTQWDKPEFTSRPLGHRSHLATSQIWCEFHPQIVHKDHKVQFHCLKQVQETSQHFSRPFPKKLKVWAFEAHKYHHHRIPSSAQVVPEPIKEASNLSELCVKDQARQVPRMEPSSLCQLWSLASLGSGWKWMKMAENQNAESGGMRPTQKKATWHNLTKFDERKAWDLWCFFNHLDIETAGSTKSIQIHYCPPRLVWICHLSTRVYWDLLRFVEARTVSGLREFLGLAFSGFSPRYHSSRAPEVTPQEARIRTYYGRGRIRRHISIADLAVRDHLNFKANLANSIESIVKNKD